MPALPLQCPAMRRPLHSWMPHANGERRGTMKGTILVAFAATAIIWCGLGQQATPPAGEPREDAEHESLAEGGWLPVLQTTDDNVSLGNRLTFLPGEDFDRAYLEHARHIVRMRQRAAQSPAGTDN